MKQPNWSDWSEVVLVEEAYMALLRLPHHAARQRLQGTLASLRDELAYLTRRDSQEVQDECENAALKTAKSDA